MNWLDIKILPNQPWWKAIFTVLMYVDVEAWFHFVFQVTMFRVKKMKRIFVPLTFLFAIYVCTYHLIESQQSQSAGKKSVKIMTNDLKMYSGQKWSQRFINHHIFLTLQIYSKTCLLIIYSIHVDKFNWVFPHFLSFLVFIELFL
jgi:hypothetical protein